MAARRFISAVVIVFACWIFAPRTAAAPPKALPAVAEGWSIELAARAPEIVYPTAIVAAPDGAVYLGSDPMDMPGPATEPIDRVLVLRNGRASLFADKLWSVMGLEWADGTLYVVHAPYLSALRDRDGDGRADERVDLVTGLGPERPGFNGINDHVASGLRLGMDGFLYIAVGDKGIFRGKGRDGATIQLHGGGVVRVRPDGSNLEVVSTGESNPLSIALSATDEIFTYGNDDDSKLWPNSLTHHIQGGHYGYPFEFRAAPRRALPIMGGEAGGIGAQGICYNEDGLPAEYRGDLFFCDWGRRTVDRFKIRKAGGTFAIERRSALVTAGELQDFRPFSLAATADGAGLWLVDWAYNGWLDGRVKTGRLYRLRYVGPNTVRPTPRPRDDGLAEQIPALDHPARSARLEAQRALSRLGTAAVPALIERLRKPNSPDLGKMHALWALDTIGGLEACGAIAAALADRSPRVRLQAARSSGDRRDRAAARALVGLLRDRDPAVRREAAIALGAIGEARLVAPALYAALGDPDRFAAWSVRQALRRLNAWDKPLLVDALLDPRRGAAALDLTDEAWALPVVEALVEARARAGSPAVRARIVDNLSGLYRRYPEWTGEWFGTNPLAGPAPEKTRDWSAEGMAGVVRGLSEALADPAASVRGRAIAGLARTGKPGVPALRLALRREPDPSNQTALAEALGMLGDSASAPILAAWLADANRPEDVRAAALGGLSGFRDRQSLNARLSLVYDPKAPERLVAAALPGLAALGFLPPYDLAPFLKHKAPAVRAAAALSFNVKTRMPDDLKPDLLRCLDDPNADVRQAAILAVAALRLPEAAPRLIALASQADAPEAERAAAVAALCRAPDPRALPIYLAAIQAPDPAARRAGESALLAVRDRAFSQIEQAARQVGPASPAARAFERVLARFEPVTKWKTIGPFPKAAPPIFVGAAAIDFQRVHTGAGGRSISWMERQADPKTGRIDLADRKRALGPIGDASHGSTHALACVAFAYAEVESERDGPALLLPDAESTVLVTVNEKVVYQAVHQAGASGAWDVVPSRFSLARGRNRILVVTKSAGAGAWGFRLKIAHVPAITGPRSDVELARTSIDHRAALRRVALRRDGDPRHGEALFFDPKGAGCSTCHSVGGRGGTTIGPDLRGIAARYDRAELVRSVLEPSQRIVPGYQPVIIATRDGKTLSGTVHAETADWIELADSRAGLQRIARADVSERRPGTVSIMPEGLADALSPTDFADLVAFLAGLKGTRPQ